MPSPTSSARDSTSRSDASRASRFSCCSRAPRSCSARPRRAGDGAFVAVDRVAQRAHQAVALGEQVVQPLFEASLLGVGATGLALLHFDRLVRIAQAARDLRAALLGRGAAVFGARDAGERVDEARVHGLALGFELAQRGRRGGHLRFEREHRVALRADHGLDLGQFTLGAAFLGARCRDLLAQPRHLFLARQARLGERGALAVFVFDAALELLDLGTQREEQLAAHDDGALALRQLQAQALEVGFALAEPRLGGSQLVTLDVEPVARGGDLAFEIAAALGRNRQFEQPQAFLEALEARGLLGLALERRDLAAQLAQHVGDAQQVLLGGVELALRFLAARLVLADAGGLFEQRAPILGLRRHDARDLALLDDRVAARADAGVAEEVEHVAQAAGRLVDQVLGVPSRYSRREIWISVKPANSAGARPSLLSKVSATSAMPTAGRASEPAKITSSIACRADGAATARPSPSASRRRRSTCRSRWVRRCR